MKCLSKKRLKRKGFGLSFGASLDQLIILAAARKAPGKDDGLSELNQEIAILKKLTHPHIVRLVEVMNDPSHDIVYMVFELMPLGLLPCLAVHW
jgi:[calcium/calmodulin-dependent protein kinase] kinase